MDFVSRCAPPRLSAWAIPWSPYGVDQARQIQASGSLPNPLWIRKKTYDALHIGHFRGLWSLLDGLAFRSASSGSLSSALSKTVSDNDHIGLYETLAIMHYLVFNID